MNQREQIDLELYLIGELFDALEGINPMFVTMRGTEREIVPVLFRNDFEKDIVSEALKRLVEATQPDYVVYASEAWSAAYPKGQFPKGTPRPSQNPNREEVLIVQIEFKTGETYGCCAKIIRDEKTVKLSEFKVNKIAIQTGRFANFYQYNEQKH